VVTEARPETTAWADVVLLKGSVQGAGRATPFDWMARIRPGPYRREVRLSFTVIQARARGKLPVADLRLDLGKLHDRAASVLWGQSLRPSGLTGSTQAVRFRQTVTGSSVQDAVFKWRCEAKSEDGWSVVGEGDRSEGLMHVATAGAAVTVALRDFAERAPKELAVVRRRDGDHVEVGILPDVGTAFALHQGEAVTVHIVLAASARGTPHAEVRSVAAGLFHPLRVVLSPADYCRSGVFGLTAPQKPVQWPEYERAVADAFAQITSKQSQYGWEDWGGVFQFGGYVPGTKKLWTNMEYDFSASCLSQFARTADTRYLERGVAATQHFHDADMIHASPNSRHLFGSHTHSHTLEVGHQVEGPNFGHAGWCQGPLWVYYMTGERAGLDVARMLAEYVCRNAPVIDDYTKRRPNYGLYEERDCGHPVLTLMCAYEATQEPKYLETAQRIVDYAMRCQEDVEGNWRTPLNEDPPYRNTTFMVSPLIRALRKYGEWVDDERVGPALALFGKWLLEQGRAPNGGYYHKVSPRHARSASLRNLGWYSHAYPICAKHTPDSERLRRELEDALSDLLSAEETNLLWEQNNYDRPSRVSRGVAGGKRGEWHEYTLAVRGRRVTLDVDGRHHHQGEFGGLPMTGFLLWSGMRAKGVMEVDWFQCEEWDAAAGRWRVVERNDFDQGLSEPWQLNRGTPGEQVAVRGGVVAVTDPDAKLYGIRWLCRGPKTQYRIRWRQRLGETMYGGAMVLCERGDMIHVGVGQGSSRGRMFTNPRSFAPKVQNLNEAIGWLRH